MGPGAGWRHPAPGPSCPTRSITLANDALSGSRADIFIGLWAAVAQIYVYAHGLPLNVVIRGDLTRDGLVAVAQSLQPYSGDR